ncbi:unnamed protein product [Symbiodinium sp. KB8]|nr:unnamed protein product [Symbiodinium sp. KB8]
MEAHAAAISTDIDTLVYTNWDSDMVVGCACDPGFAGYDCSMRVCVQGRDPLEVNHTEAMLGRKLHNEIQIVSCEWDPTEVQTEGFRFLFKGHLTRFIPYTASKEEVELALYPLTGLVDVRFLAEGQFGACTSSGASHGVMSVEFLHLLEDVPALRVEENYRSTHGEYDDEVVRNFHVGSHQHVDFMVADGVDDATPIRGHDGLMYYAQRGEHKQYECSRRGLCDYFSGLCHCFDEYIGDAFEPGEGVYDNCGSIRPEVEVTDCPGRIENGEERLCINA